MGLRILRDAEQGSQEGGSRCQGPLAAQSSVHEALLRAVPADGAILQQVVAELPACEELFSVPWGHIRTLIDKCHDDREKAEFYIHKTVENGWSRAVLLNELSKLIPKELRDSLPTIEEIEAELRG